MKNMKYMSHLTYVALYLCLSFVLNDIPP